MSDGYLMWSGLFERMEKASDVIMPLLLLAIGLALLLDSVWYFVRGESFF